MLTLFAALLMGMVAIGQTNNEAEPVEEIFTVVEKDPQFPGGDEALYKYLVTNAHYPEEAKSHGIQGTVYLQFIVERDGTISNINVLRSPSDLLSNEARRLVKAMPRWKAGKQRGKSVRVLYTLPINFSL